MANEELLNANKELLADDELLIVQGKVQNDRFSGGLRMNVTAIWDLAGARAKFGKFLRVPPGAAAPALDEVLKTWPAKVLETEQGRLLQGLPLRLSIRRPGAVAELDLGDAARFWPCDEALQKLGEAQIVYE